MQLSQNLQIELESLYPALFANKNPMNSCMNRGCCIGDGWFALFARLCAQVQARVTQAKSPQPVLIQVKEKFGSLRVYWRGADDYVRELTELAETKSLQTCEACGEAGGLIREDGSNLRVRCELHKTCRPKTSTHSPKSQSAAT